MSNSAFVEQAAKVEQSLAAVMKWVEDRNYKGHDPADGNASPLHYLTFGSAMLQRMLQQAVLRAPWNIRPLLGIRPLESTKARGYMVSGYVLRYQQTKDALYRNKAIICLDWLLQNKSPGYKQFSWGNHYSYATRSGKLPKLEPIIVWTVLIGFGFLDAYEAFGDRKYLAVAESICDWILSLPREKTANGTCISYHAFQRTSIHNSNMLGAAMLARTARAAGSTNGLELAREAMVYSCSRQLADGAWLYGADPKYGWIDNFHTGYNLDCLKTYIDCTGDVTFEPNLRRGFSYFINTFFEQNGRPKYFHDKTYPVDIQCASQAIETLSLFAGEVPSIVGGASSETPLQLALKVANWTIDNMQAGDGHFYYRDLGWTKVRTPLIHWGQATMFKALARLLQTLHERAAHKGPGPALSPVSATALA